MKKKIGLLITSLIFAQLYVFSFVACANNTEPTKNLAYKLNYDNDYYILTGIGEATEVNIVIPSTYEGLPVKEIKDGAFRELKEIESVEIPDSVKYMGDHVFNGCTRLKNVKLGTGLKMLPSGTFNNCESLIEISVPDNITLIDTWVFGGCSSLKSVVLPSYIFIRNYAFYDCTSLKTVFCKGDSKTDITIGANNSDLGYYATWYYYSEEKPMLSGNYWHYVNNVLTIW